MLGTPTAAPPKWLMDEFPEIAPIDEQGRPRGFGSRRHYTFSSQAMVRLWTLEAHSHGADVVSYFRWRQASFAQEQMHAGLNLPSSHELSQGGERRRRGPTI